MLTIYDTRPASVTAPRKTVHVEYTCNEFTYTPDGQQYGRLRSDSLPEARHFRRLRRELSLDSDLDRYKHNVDPPFPPSRELKSWKTKRVTHKLVDAVIDKKAEVVVISTEPVGAETPGHEVSESPTGVPWTNWTKWNISRALEITGENLEDLLAYDDLFLDFFNAFLALPVFPQVMRYNRLTGAFEEINSNGQNGFNSSLPYGVSDDERDYMLEWARKERLPLFLSTQLFREFKLCKLLLRPLDDRYSASRGSSHQIRGYSRQSESYVSSLSNSADNSAGDVDDEDFTLDGHYNTSQLFRYQRPGSRALSVPAPIMYGYDPFMEEARGSTTTHTHDTSKTASLKHRNKKFLDEIEVGDPDLLLDLDEEAEVVLPRESTVTFDPDTADPEGKSLRSFSRRSSRMSRTKRGQAPQSDAEAAFLRGARVLSAPINYDDYMKHPYRDFDMMFGEDEPEPDGNVYVTFDDEGVSEAQTETDVKNMEGRLKMTIQQMKETLLGHFLGMEDFKIFLSGTIGKELVNFWLDCEYFKDCMEKFDEVAIMEKRNRLFRDIQDKYKMNLSKDAKEQITKAASNSNLSHSIFIRTQYDVLRRLRAYWLPRFMLHQEREAKTELKEERYDSNRWVTMQNSLKDSFSFFPSINLVSSMPVKPDDVLTYTKTKNWESVSKGGRRLDDRVTSAKYRRGPTISAFSGVLGFSTFKSPKHSATKERFLVALAADKFAGGPFERYLACFPDQSLLSSLLFWQDVTEYGAAEDRAADRLLRLCNAWAIFNKYIADDSNYNIEVSANERNTIHKDLMSAKDFVESSVFNNCKQHAVDTLEEIWIRFLKEDLKKFLDCRLRPGISPPSTAAIEITLTNDEVIISRPRPWLKHPPSTDSERAKRARAQMSMEDLDEEQRAILRAKRREARKEMERERRKAVRAAYKRLKDSKSKKSDDRRKTKVENKESESEVTPEEEKKDDDLEYDENGEKKSAKPPPPFHEMISNKAYKTRIYMGSSYLILIASRPNCEAKHQTHFKIISNYKKNLIESEEKDMLNNVNLFMDIETFFSYGTNKKESARREQHGNHIQKTYIDSHGKKRVELPDKIKTKLHEKERPKTAVMKEIQHTLHTKIDESFKNYLGARAEEQGMEPGELVKLSQAELSMRLGTDGGSSWKKARGKGKDGEDREYSHPSVRITISKLKKKVHFSKEGTETSMYSEGTDYTYTSSQEGSSSAGTPRGVGSSQLFRRPKRARFHMKTGRSQPHKDDREEFYKALKQSAQGKMTLHMLYFYKYLLKHGEEDNMPLIDKDLFFYIEVQKFKDCSHQYADEEILRRKVQSILDCFLESITTPSLQIDINNEVQQKSVRAAQRYVAGKDIFSNIFDEAQLSVFKELLPYWAGFRKSQAPPSDDSKRPVTKYEKMLKKRLENIDNYQVPSSEFHLPSIPEGSAAAFSFTLSEGVKVREYMNGDDFQFNFLADASARSSKVDLRTNTSKRRMSVVSTSLQVPPSSTPKKDTSATSVKS